MKVNCGECRGTGIRTRKVPKAAFAMPEIADDWEWKTTPCWRCAGAGKLESNTTTREGIQDNPDSN